MIIVLIMLPRMPGWDWGFGTVFWVGRGGRQYNVSVIVCISTTVSTAMSRDIHTTQTRPLCGTNTSQVSILWAFKTLRVFALAFDRGVPSAEAQLAWNAIWLGAKGYEKRRGHVAGWRQWAGGDVHECGGYGPRLGSGGAMDVGLPGSLLWWCHVWVTIATRRHSRTLVMAAYTNWVGRSLWLWPSLLGGGEGVLVYDDGISW